MDRTSQLLLDIDLPETHLFYGGQWHEARSGRSFETIDPATEQVIAHIDEPDIEDVYLAVQAAREAFEHGPWGTMRGVERGRILHRLAHLLVENQDRVIAIESLDCGKPLAAVRRMDFPAAVDCLEYYAGWADKLSGRVVPVRPDALTYVDRVPVGVVAGIVPWNFPLMNAMWKIAPALACGCTVVLKPAAETPLSALLLAELAAEAGLPPGVLNVLPGPGPTTGAALVAHPGIDKISFTGSPAVGKQIMESAARHLPRVTLELGGKSPNVVFDDANLDSAVRAASAGAFFNSGQVCSAGTRLLVQEGIYEDFCEALAARASSLVVGDPQSPDTYIGPLISQRQLDRVLGYIELGRGEGAQLVAGGERPDGPGYFIPPTVFTNVRNDMTIAREEIFGPVLSVIKFANESDAVRIANDSPYSLAAAVWTRDVSRAHRMASKLRAGTVWVNTYGNTDVRLPWGGLGGDSGIGRDLGESALENYLDTKSVWVNLQDRS